MTRPVVLSLFKPAGPSSYDIVRKSKRALGQLGERRVKLGHFGTLDPFASGLLLLGLHGASRLNNFIHDDLSKTYLAIGKLGVKTPTGDLTVEPTISDFSKYFKEEVPKFERSFLQDKLQEFLGEYWQAPHVYSAAKFKGRPLHEWARAGEEIHKPAVKRFIHKIDLVKFSYPYFIFRSEVSSGTYIRSLFEDIAKELGTCGALVSLVRESIGTINACDAFRFRLDNATEIYAGEISLTELLPYEKIDLPEDRAKAFLNGLPVLTFQSQLRQAGSLSTYFWIYKEGGEFPLGLAFYKDDRFHVKFNFPQQ